MKKILLLVLIILLSAGCVKKEKKSTFTLEENGLGDGSDDTTNTVLFQNRNLSR